MTGRRHERGRRRGRFGEAAYFRCAVLCFAVLLLGGFVCAGCEKMPEMCGEDVRRIEFAYAAGLAAASNDTEARQCRRIRNAELHALVEQTYAALLVRLADDAPLMGTVQEEQGRLLADLAPGLRMDATSEELDAASRLLLDRLRVFATLLDALRVE